MEDFLVTWARGASRIFLAAVAVLALLAPVGLVGMTGAWVLAKCHLVADPDPLPFILIVCALLLPWALGR